MRRVGIGGKSGRRSQNFFEKDQIAGFQQAAAAVIDECGPGGTLRKAALLIAPRVEVDLVQFGMGCDIEESLKCLCPLAERRWNLIVGDAAPRSIGLREQKSSGRDELSRARIGLEKNECPSVAAIVHEVVEQAGMATDGNALA